MQELDEARVELACRTAVGQCADSNHDQRCLLYFFAVMSCKWPKKLYIYICIYAHIHAHLYARMIVGRARPWTGAQGMVRCLATATTLGLAVAVAAVLPELPELACGELRKGFCRLYNIIQQNKTKYTKVQFNVLSYEVIQFCFVQLFHVSNVLQD